jgi:hypothetical protein
LRPASATRGAVLLFLPLLRHVLAGVIAGVGFLHRQGQRIALVIRLLLNLLWLQRRRAKGGLLAFFSALGGGGWREQGGCVRRGWRKNTGRDPESCKHH